MAQKTDLNVTPYYDDYNEADQFHKVLFKPGKAVQARELTTLQSIQQNQIERFGRHIFKEGSIVIPGSVGYDENYYALKLQATYVVGTNTYTIANHLANYVGTQITGETSGAYYDQASVDDQALPTVPYADNKILETDGDNILDFTELDPWSEGDL